MLRFRKSVVTMVAALAGAGFAYSSTAVAQAVPPTLTQQGRLLDSDGAAVDGVTLAFAFSIYGTETGGTPIWTENQSITPDKGYFSARLGEVNPALAAVFDGSHGSLYLGIRIGADTEMTPRQKLTSVPFALLALNAASANAAGGALDTRITTLENGKADKTNVALVTAWQNYTPCGFYNTTAPTANLGTGNCVYRRVGDSAEIRAMIHFTTAPAATPPNPPTYLALRLPPALTVDATKIPSQPDVPHKQAAVGSGWVYSGAGGSGIRTVVPFFYDDNIIMRTSQVPNDTGFDVGPNGPFNLQAADITLTVTVPISGWSVNPP